MTTQAAPAQWDRWVGLPFEDGGRGPEAFDCWGLVRQVLIERFGVEPPSYDEYESTHDVAAITRVVGRAIARSARVPAVEVLAGDLVLFRIAGALWHVGLVVDPAAARFLHVMARTHSVIESWSAWHWRARVRGFYRWTP